MQNITIHPSVSHHLRRLMPLALLAATACASQPHSAAQATAPQTTAPPVTPVSASIPPVNPNFPQQRDFFTSLSVRDAAEHSLTALVQKLGFDYSNSSDNVEVHVGSPDTTLVAYPHTADYFSAISELTTASGNKVRIDCEWLKEGQTRVTLQSDLPEDRFALVEKVISNSLEETTLH